MKHGMTPCRVIATVKLTASSSFALLRIKTVGLHKSCHRSRLNYTPLNLITCEASMHLQHRKSLLKPRRHAQTTIHCSLRLYITCSWLMYMTDQNMGDEDVTRHFRTTYHLSAEQRCRAWCEHADVHVWFLKRLYECESRGRSGTVALFTARSAHARRTVCACSLRRAGFMCFKRRVHGVSILWVGSFQWNDWTGSRKRSEWFVHKLNPLWSGKCYFIQALYAKTV